MILPKERDPRFITIRRGGTLTDADHRLLATWAAVCAEHVLPLFETERPSDPRPRLAIEQIRTWVRGGCTMSESRAAGGHAMAAVRSLRGAARHAAFAAGQAGVTAHVAAHELGAAAYAIKAARASVPASERDRVGRRECRWQRRQLPAAIRELVLDDQRRLGELQPLIAAFDEVAPPGPVPLVRGWIESQLGSPTVEASVDRAVEVLFGLERYAAWLGVAAITTEAAAAVRHPRTAELAALLEPHRGRHAVIVTIGYLGAIDRYLGLAAAATGDRERAAVLLRQAQVQHEAVGARCYLDRTAAELAAL